MGEYEESDFDEENKDNIIKLNKISRKDISELINEFEPLEENHDINEFYESKFKPNDEDQAIENTLEGGFIPKDEFKEKKNKPNTLKKADVKNETCEIDQKLKKNKKKSQNISNNPEKNEMKSLETIKSTRELLIILRNDLEKKLPKFMIINGIKTNMFYNGRLSWYKLSYIISKYGHRIRRIKRNIRANPHFKVALDELEERKHNLRSILGDKSINAINIINNYSRSNHDLPISSKNKVLNYHPNLKFYYFNEINTRDKAYWLGFLWGELYIGKGSALSLDLSKKDE